MREGGALLRPFVSEGRTHTAGHLRVPAVVGRRAPEGPAEDELRHTVEERSPCGQRNDSP